MSPCEGTSADEDLVWRPADPVGSYRLFLDDLRFPTSTEGTAIARSSEEAIDVVRRLGMPVHVDYDHDLGGDDTAMRFVRWLVDHVLDRDLDVADLTYSVHSSNPPGAENVTGLMEGLLRRARERRAEAADGRPGDAP